MFWYTIGEIDADLQVRRCDGTSGTGFHLQIPGSTTTSFINLGIPEPEHGGLKVTPMWNGNFLGQVLSYGFMENVSILYRILS
jgi:hypothetical protein